ncbi:hypothetical protein HOY80DRAFT_1141617 [Tuber brumale]|nr:hypothetical protein HOY80DRAFT_1141617 [Tuber brumale]
MANPGINYTARPDARPTTEPLPDFTPQLQQPSPPLPSLSWKAINEPKYFYDVQDLVDPSPGLTSEKLRDRKEDDVVIFDYSLDPRYLRGGLTSGEGGPSSRSSSVDDDLFLQDFGLLNLIGEKLGLQKEGETAFMDAHLRRVQALRGRERFRTGISLRVPFNKPPELSGSDLPEDISTLFISVPYLGKYTSRIQLGPQSESVRLLDFKQLGAKVPYHRDEESREERDDIGKILVHQARYMIFDNNTVAIFKSKEDSANDQFPLHWFQERIGALRAVIHMIANRMDQELWTLGKLQASLFKLEQDIDQLIPGAKTHDDNQGTAGTPADGQSPAGVSWTERVVKYAREENVRKGEQSRLRDLLTSLNRLSAASLAAICVAERQIVVLQDIHNLFSASCRAKVRESDQRYRSRQNPFYKTSVPIPILSENPEQIFPATLDTIDEMVHGRKSFILKIRELADNVDIRRKMLFGFFSPGPAYVAIGPDHTPKNISIPGALMNTYVSVLAAIYVPLSFWTSFYGMNVKELAEGSTTLENFILSATPSVAGSLVLLGLVSYWGPLTARLRPGRKAKLIQYLGGGTLDIESQA